MTENEMMNGWTFEETIKTAENLMEEENNVFKWDVLRHLRDFAEHYKEQLEQYIAIGLTPTMVKDLISMNQKHHKCALENAHLLDEYQAIGTIEEFKALKEKNTPMELAEHNFQDEVHHYLCPRCRSIVSCNQNYCEECGQALET